MQTNEVINLSKDNQVKKELFSNIEAEQALIGSIRWDNKNFEKVADFLDDKHFVDPNNQIIFKTISMLLNKVPKAITDFRNISLYVYVPNIN